MRLCRHDSNFVLIDHCRYCEGLLIFLMVFPIIYTRENYFDCLIAFMHTKFHLKEFYFKSKEPGQIFFPF